MPLKILIVDHNSDTCQLLHFLFSLNELAVVMAEDGEEGLEKAKAERPDLIVTDLPMPYMNGAEMIEQIRSDANIAHTPIVIYTARKRNLIDSSLSEWAEKIFYKPIDFHNLLAFVKTFMVQKSQPDYQFNRNF